MEESLTTTPLGSDGAKPQNGGADIESGGGAGSDENMSTGQQEEIKHNNIPLQMKEEAAAAAAAADHETHKPYKEEMTADDDDEGERGTQPLLEYEGSFDSAGGAGSIYSLGGTGKSSLYSASSSGLEEAEAAKRRGLKYESSDSRLMVEEATDSLAPLPKVSTSRRRPNLSEFKTAKSGSTSSRDILMKSSIRISVTKGLDADGGNGFRAQSAKIRDPAERMPHCRQRRGMKAVSRLANPFWKKKEPIEPDLTDKKGRSLDANNSVRAASGRYTQYRMTSIDTTYEHTTGQLHFGGFSAGIYDDEGANDTTNSRWWIFKPNQMVVSYLFWAFRSSFLAVLLSAAVWFTSLTFMFSLCIYLIGWLKPKCIHVNGVDFGESGWFADLMDAYALSWTTFSTVGYGLVFPATSATAEDVRQCFGITIFSTLESFVGILFASFWGAIFLSKVTRVSSFAQVTFSDPIVLKYGPGLSIQQDEEELSDDDEEKANRKRVPNFTRSKLPCPVLEFRVLNRLEAQKHGEIIDATMNIVASIDEAQIRSASKMKDKKKKRRKKKSARSGGRGVKDYLDDEEIDEDAAEQSEKKLEHLLRKRTTLKRRASMTIDEDPTGVLVSRKIFAKLEIESQEHPFFKRIWNARHVLDQDSPLLKQDAKDLILLNGGHWPEELNSAEAVRASMHFDQILVSLSGTSNADCNSVYAQKVYDYVDLCVGYRFCNVLYRDVQGMMRVDAEILNDVTEQYGGGAEDLHDRVAESASEIFIL